MHYLDLALPLQLDWTGCEHYFFAVRPFLENDASCPVKHGHIPVIVGTYVLAGSCTVAFIPWLESVC